MPQVADSFLSAFAHSGALQETLEDHSYYPLVSNFILSPSSHYYWMACPSPQPVWRRCHSSELNLEHFTGDEGEVFFDVNKLSVEGESASEMWGHWSETGKYWATTISRGGSDHQTVLIIDTETGKQVDDELQNVKFCWSIEWLGDAAFIYKRLPPKHKDDTSAEGGFESVLHRLGTSQSEDIHIWADREHPQHSALTPFVTHDKKHLVLNIFGSTDPVMRLLSTSIDGLTDGRAKFRDVNESWDASYIYITTTSQGDSIFMTSREGALRKKLVSTNLSEITSPTKWTVVCPEHPEAVLSRAQALGQGLLLLVYSLHVSHQVWIYKESGEVVRRVSDKELPWSAMVKNIERGREADEISIETSSYIASPTLYRGVVGGGDVCFSLLHVAEVTGWNESDYIQKQFYDAANSKIFYDSKDSTKVPMHIVHSRSLDLSKPHPTLLFGYGGFAWAQEPRWQPLFSAFIMSFNGILAVAGIRGGDEYGHAWHKAAIKTKRQNGYDDFIAGAKWLKVNGVASKLIIHGNSNGERILLCPRSSIPRCSFVLGGSRVSIADPRVGLPPVLMVLPSVGVMDLLRFHLFTMGGLWTAEYGSPDVEEEFKALLKISPLHNVTTDLKYPPVFLTTAEHDSRVIPGHTLKFAATLQEKKGKGSSPILCRIFQDTGHGMGKSTAQSITENKEKLSFVALALGIDVEN
ncbi:hypothetical protein FRB96_005410 [Tulasnella sp. 330]|nr:hypothetical protein FRB96_005410 [Tulasnella sp. 330]KAG8882999.1 hypothetical protein FRB97_007372 [Tulasnella sp. 331]KAG8888494.1 hypothetical protein FRB98_007534 [Tulasnella sp. 332]